MRHILSPNQLCFVGALLCFVQGSASFAASTRETLEEHAKQSAAFLREGKLPEAESELRRVLKLNPNLPQFQNLMGLVLDRQGKHDQATPHFLKAIELNPAFAVAHHNLGLNYVQLGRFGPAEQSFLKALGQDPNQAAAHYHLGRLRLRNRQYERALESFQSAHRLAPDRREILLDLMRTEVRLGRSAAAEGRAEKLRQGLENDAPATAKLALELARSRLYPQAIAAYERVLREHPDLAEILYDLALSYLRNGQPNKSVQTLARIGSEQHDAAYFALLGAGYGEMGEPERSLAAWRRALEMAPDNEEYIYDLGITLLAANEAPEALRLLEQASQRNPENPKLLYALGVASYLNGREAEAERLLGKAVQLGPEAAEFHASLGDLYKAAAQHEKAQGSYEEAIRLDPAVASYHVKAGRNLVQLRQTQEAQAAFKTVLTLDPKNAEAHYELGKMSATLGEHEQTVTEFERAVALDSTLKEAYYQLAMAYRRLKNTTKAREALQRFEELKSQEKAVDLSRPPR